MCLLIGTPGVGKTLLMKRMEVISSSPKSANNGFTEVPTTISTVGTNLATVSCGRQGEVTVRELGGCMGPIWKDYYSDCSALMFMIDVSNRLQIAAACIQLLSVLSSQSLAKVPVLLIYNKIDMPNIMQRSEIESMLRLDEIKSHASQTISELDISASKGQGVLDVIKWLERSLKKKS